MSAPSPIARMLADRRTVSAAIAEGALDRINAMRADEGKPPVLASDLLPSKAEPSSR